MDMNFSKEELWFANPLEMANNIQCVIECLRILKVTSSTSKNVGGNIRFTADRKSVATNNKVYVFMHSYNSITMYDKLSWTSAAFEYNMDGRVSVTRNLISTVEWYFDSLTTFRMHSSNFWTIINLRNGHIFFYKNDIKKRIYYLLDCCKIVHQRKVTFNRLLLKSACTGRII